MLSPWIYLMMNGLFFTLRLSGGSGSFPRPLKAAEEREYLERAAQLAGTIPYELLCNVNPRVPRIYTGRGE